MAKACTDINKNIIKVNVDMVIKNSSNREHSRNFKRLF